MKIMAADFDGTLYINQKISAENIQSIKQWQRQGNRFGLITGRDQIMITEKLQNQDINLDFVIGNNGGVINGQAYAPLEVSEVAELLASNYEEGSAHVFFFTPASHIVYIQGSNSRYNQREYSELHYLETLVVPTGEPIIQVSYEFPTIAQAQKVTDAINSNPNLVLKALQNKKSVDVVNQTVNKASGLARYLEEQTEVYEQVIVIGDGENDREMLVAYDSYSLLHAPAEIQALADHNVSSVAACLMANMVN